MTALNESDHSVCCLDYLLVSSFIRPSSMLTERCALWDSRETLELSVLTPEVATVSS